MPDTTTPADRTPTDDTVAPAAGEKADPGPARQRLLVGELMRELFDRGRLDGYRATRGRVSC